MFKECEILEPNNFLMSVVFRNLRERYAAPVETIVIDDDEPVNQGKTFSIQTYICLYSEHMITKNFRKFTTRGESH